MYLFEASYGIPSQLYISVILTCAVYMFQNNVDPSTIEQVVRSAICGAVTSLILPARGGFPSFSNAGKQDFVTPTVTTHRYFGLLFGLCKVVNRELIVV